MDTDITAELVDVFPDGKAIHLFDGILRLRYRNSLSTPELMTPGEVYEVTVPMSVTSNVFLPGHRIRLDVSGSEFPHYDRNSNTAGSPPPRPWRTWSSPTSRSTTAEPAPVPSSSRSPTVEPCALRGAGVGGPRPVGASSGGASRSMR